MFSMQYTYICIYIHTYILVLHVLLDVCRASFERGNFSHAFGSKNAVPRSDAVLCACLLCMCVYAHEVI